MGRYPTKGIDAAAQDINQPEDVILPGMDDGPIRRTDQIIEPVDGPVSNSMLGEMAFSEEMIDVVVHESTDPNAENPVMVYCNGVPQFFLRGQTQTVKRKFVEVLARAKQTAIQTIERPMMGDTVVRKSRSLRYPFSIVQDRNPNGTVWIRKVLAEA